MKTTGTHKGRSPLFFLALACLLLVLVSACSKKPGDEDLIRQAVHDAVEAAGAKDVSGFISVLSKDYSDDYGNDYDAARGIIFYQFMRPGEISVFIRSLDIKVTGQSAAVNARAVLVRGKPVKGIASVIPGDAEAYSFRLVFKKEAGDWKVAGAGWEAVGVAGLL